MREILWIKEHEKLKVKKIDIIIMQTHSSAGCRFCHIFSTKEQKGSSVKSIKMKRCLSQFCTVKQNQLPLACLGVEGEGSAQKQCNYSALAQQQRAKRASKAFLWAKRGSSEEKAQPVCEYQCMDLWFSLSEEEVCQEQSYSAQPHDCVQWESCDWQLAKLVLNAVC